MLKFYDSPAPFPIVKTDLGEDPQRAPCPSRNDLLKSLSP